MANRYWVWWTATRDATAWTKWALTSWWAGGETVPWVNDDVYLEWAYTITLWVNVSVWTIWHLWWDFDTAGYDISCKNYLAYTTAAARSLTLGDSVITISWSANTWWRVWDYTIFTLYCWTSTIIMWDGEGFFIWWWHIYYNVEINTLTVSPYAFLITSSNTFNTLTIWWDGPQFITFWEYTQTIWTFVCNSSLGHEKKIQWYPLPSLWTLVVASWIINLDYVSVWNMNFTWWATRNIWLHSTNLWNNSWLIWLNTITKLDPATITDQV